MPRTCPRRRCIFLMRDILRRIKNRRKLFCWWNNLWRPSSPGEFEHERKRPRRLKGSTDYASRHCTWSNFSGLFADGPYGEAAHAFGVAGAGPVDIGIGPGRILSEGSATGRGIGGTASRDGSGVLPAGDD